MIVLYDYVQYKNNAEWEKWKHLKKRPQKLIRIIKTCIIKYKKKKNYKLKGIWIGMY